MSFEFVNAIPIFRIFDLAKAKEFYVGFLGFTVDWEHRFYPESPVYLQVSRAGLSLHLSEHHGDATPGSIVYVRMTGVDDFHREITSKGYRFMNPGIQDREWGTREMCVIDPFGNHIRFSEEIKKNATT